MKKLFYLLVSVMVFSVSTVAFAQNTTGEDIEKAVEKIVENATIQELSDDQKDSVLHSKLSSDQIFELKKQELEVEKQRIEARTKNDMPLGGFGIVMICLLPFAFVTTLVFLNVRRKNMESKRRYELYMKSLEMGQTVPEHFFDAPKQENKASNLKRGILLLMVGLAFGLFVIVQQRTSLPFLLATFIPGFVGIGYLLIHFLEKPKKETTEISDEQNR
jgi:hypothetical protein